MKIKIINSDKIVIYLYNYFFKTLEKDIITKEIKNIFLKLIKNYHIKINGVYEILVFSNNQYGTILEITKQEELLFHNGIIDLKVKIMTDCFIYLKTNNYFILEKYHNIYYQENNYFIDIKEIDNLINLIEHIDIIYNQDNNYLTKMIFIK